MIRPAARLVIAVGTAVLAGGALGAPASQMITLGTNSGPIPNPRRAEPALLLRAGSENLLIDAGDAASWQLAKAGVDLGAVHTVILSHLHFDHTGGLFAFLSQRYQAINPSAVTIFGPPGTRGLVASLVAAMTASLDSVGNVRARAVGGLGDNLNVVEVGDGARFSVGEVQVTAVANTHFVASLPGSAGTPAVSLAYRFDLPDRSLVYTGDTGPSAAVERLAIGADVLFCEIMDPDAALAALVAARPDVPAAAIAMVAAHFHREHMSPTEVGLLASRAAVKSLVLVHDALADGDIPAARTAIVARYHGPVRFAADLDRF